MEQDRRDVFKKIGLLGATALGLVGISKVAKADEAAASNTLVGLWDLTFPPPNNNLIYKYAISEGGYVATGNLDATAAVFGFAYSPTMGSYIRTGHNSYRLRERSWAMDPKGNPAGSTDFTGSATVAENGKTFAGSGTYTQYDLNGDVLFAQPITYTATKFPTVPPTG
jgi:hypothetical protein